MTRKSKMSRQTDQSSISDAKTTEPIKITCEPAIDIFEAAEILRVHPNTVRRHAKTGTIPAFRIGTQWRFRASSLDEWMKAQLSSLPQNQTARDR
jgi:excisionase family DNA binding protein